MRGQTSLELLVTIGIVFAFTIPVLFLLLSATSIGFEDTSKAQADASARTLADAMNSVYAQGPGASRVILLNVPSNTEEIVATESEAIVRIQTGAGIFEAASPTIAEISGDSQTLGKKTGLFVLRIENNANGEVELIEE